MVILALKPRTLGMLSKCPTTELHPNLIMSRLTFLVRGAFFWDWVSWNASWPLRYWLWPWTSALSAFISQMLGLQAWTTTLGLMQCRGLNLWLCTCKTGALPTELHSQCFNSPHPRYFLRLCNSGCPGLALQTRLALNTQRSTCLCLPECWD